MISIPSSDIAWSETKQPKNIFQCFTCFLKKPSDWTWEQEKKTRHTRRSKVYYMPKIQSCADKEWSASLLVSWR